jgi:hypothetical protein
MGSNIPKVEIDTEKLVAWAYQDELSKRSVSAAEGIWDKIQENQHHGGIDPGHSAAQRYAHFGLPDADAERIEREVGLLEDMVIDWPSSFDAVAADLKGLISVNDLTKREAKPRTPHVGWGQAGTKAIKAFFGKDGARAHEDRPRDVLMVGSLRTSALVTMHAVRGTRPDWIEDTPNPEMIPALKGPNAMIVGECRGRNLYSIGAYCPLKWSPSPLSILSSRAEYVAWHHGLVELSRTLNLSKFTPLPPKASPTPWLDAEREAEGNVIRLPVEGHYGTLPLHPARDRMGPPKRSPRAGPVRYPREACGT